MYSSVLQSIELLKYGVPAYTGDAYYVAMFSETNHDLSFIGKWINAYITNWRIELKRVKDHMPEDYIMPCRSGIVEVAHVMPAWSARQLKGLIPESYRKNIKNVQDVIEALYNNDIYFNNVINLFSLSE